MNTFIAYYRYNTISGSNPHDYCKTIQAKSLAEAKRIAKELVGREEQTTWLMEVVRKEATP